MQPSLLEIITCPVCKGRLELKDALENAVEIETGALYCPACALTYPIKDGIPHLVPPE